jgi:heterodisulfide reductase subunit B
MPTSLDTLILTLGAQPIHFPIKSQCCGGTLSVTKEKLGLRMIKDILLCAAQNNADCIVTTCPLCQINLDVYQKKVNKRYRQNFSIPILYFTQLMGLAMGIPVKKLAIKKTITPVKPVLGRYYI